MQLLSQTSFALLAAMVTSTFAAAIERDVHVIERAALPSQQCVQAEKYEGIYNGIYSPACAVLVCLVSPFPISLGSLLSLTPLFQSGCSYSLRRVLPYLMDRYLRYEYQCRPARALLPLIMGRRHSGA